MAELLTTDQYVAGVRAGDPAILGRAITLVESARADHRLAADELVQALLPFSGSAHRVGITGVPGVGKSTFIESLGGRLTAKGRRVAVLAVDPTSSRTGGSILGDKTRMPTLAADTNAFIRPSPSSGTLGGVTRATRESIVVVEAAGFDVVLVETVGVGQSEIVVHGMVDCFLVLMLAGAGDELQGIKKGILELADLLAVNKADGSNEVAARAAARTYASALHLLEPSHPDWTPPVVTCSGLHGVGLDELWAHVEAHRELMVDNGAFAAKRLQQQISWMWSMVDDRLRVAARAIPQRAAIEAAVLAGEVTPARAAADVLSALRD